MKILGNPYYVKVTIWQSNYTKNFDTITFKVFLYSDSLNLSSLNSTAAYYSELIKRLNNQTSSKQTTKNNTENMNHNLTEN